MKNNQTLGWAVVVFCLGLSVSSHGALIGYNFDWTGDRGFSVSGMIQVDDTVGIASAEGAGATNGIESLMIDVFDPSNTLIQSNNNVMGGVSSYQFLFVRFDTVAGIFDLSVPGGFNASFDVGQDPGPAGFFHFDTVANRFELQSRGFIRDFGGRLAVTPKSVSEPGSLALVGLGLIALLIGRRRAAR